jgi:hypothetical protein
MDAGDTNHRDAKITPATAGTRTMIGYAAIGLAHQNRHIENRFAK